MGNGRLRYIRTMPSWMDDEGDDVEVEASPLPTTWVDNIANAGRPAPLTYNQPSISNTMTQPQLEAAQWAIPGDRVDASGNLFIDAPRGEMPLVNPSGAPPEPGFYTGAGSNRATIELESGPAANSPNSVINAEGLLNAQAYDATRLTSQNNDFGLALKQLQGETSEVSKQNVLSALLSFGIGMAAGGDSQERIALGLIGAGGNLQAQAEQQEKIHKQTLELLAQQQKQNWDLMGETRKNIFELQKEDLKEQRADENRIIEERNKRELETFKTDESIRQWNATTAKKEREEKNLSPLGVDLINQISSADSLDSLSKVQIPLELDQKEISLILQQKKIKMDEIAEERRQQRQAGESKRPPSPQELQQITNNERLITVIQPLQKLIEQMPDSNSIFRATRGAKMGDMAKVFADTESPEYRFYAQLDAAQQIFARANESGRLSDFDIQLWTPLFQGIPFVDSKKAMKDRLDNIIHMQQEAKKLLLETLDKGYVNVTRFQTPINPAPTGYRDGDTKIVNGITWKRVGGKWQEVE